MPDFSTPNGITSTALVIDFAQLPPPDVIETIAYETLLVNYKNRVLTANPALAAALKLEQSATNIILETEAYGEMLLRARVNAAARAVMLAFSTKADLNNLGALYNVARLPLVTTPRNVSTYPQDWESDAAYRRRIQLAPEAFATAGSAGAYVYQALTADVTLRDASAIVTDSLAGVRVTVMNSGVNPTPTAAQIQNVRNRIFQPNVKPLTDQPVIVGPKITTTAIQANVTLYPGPDSSIVVSNINAALLKVRNRISMLGYDLTRAACISALYQEGVENVELISPAADVLTSADGCVLITQASVTILNTRMT